MWLRSQGTCSTLASSVDGSEVWHLAWLNRSLPTEGKIVAEKLQWQNLTRTGQRWVSC